MKGIGQYIQEIIRHIRWQKRFYIEAIKFCQGTEWKEKRKSRRIKTIFSPVTSDSRRINMYIHANLGLTFHSLTNQGILMFTYKSLLTSV